MYSSIADGGLSSSTSSTSTTEARPAQDGSFNIVHSGSDDLSKQLQAALERADIRLARHLLSLGADPLWLNDEQETSLHTAALCGNVECIKLLLDECGLPADSNPGATLEYRWLGPDTPLMHAASYGHLDAAKLLIERNACVNYRSFSPEGVRFSILLAAVESGHLQVAQLLSSHGATRHFLAGHTAQSTSRRAASSEEREAEAAGWDRLREWLAQSRDWQPLHHLEFLTVPRTISLLRDGHSPKAATQRSGTPADRARQLLVQHGIGGGRSSRASISSTSSSEEERTEEERSAELIVQADGPWSPESHYLRPWGCRQRACDVLHVCYALRRTLSEAGRVPQLNDQSLVDVWIDHVVPVVLALEEGSPFLRTYAEDRKVEPPRPPAKVVEVAEEEAGGPAASSQQGAAAAGEVEEEEEQDVDENEVLTLEEALEELARVHGSKRKTSTSSTSSLSVQSLEDAEARV